MILRALGYDKNGEFTGTNWTIQTAAVGEQRGITKNITAGTLNVPATREVVAEILFRAILVNKVNYTPAFGYQLDDTPAYVCVKDGETATLEITNQRMSSIMIHKIDSETREGIYGVKFILYDAGKNPVGEYTTDQDGYIWIDDSPPGPFSISDTTRHR